MPYIGRDLNRGNYLKLDDISSSFNSSTKTFNLTVGGSAFTPGSAFSILVSVGGVIQEPESAYQVNNSEITFANAPTAQDSFFCIALGAPIGIGVPGNSTVNGTQMAKPFNYDGFFYLNDSSNRVGINSSIPTVALDVVGNTKISGDVNVSGILTAGTYSGPISNPSGISTFYNLRVTNNLTVEGTTSTLDTTLIGVDRVEVGANSNSIVGVAVTQSGTADIVRLFDGASQVVTVDDTGNIGIGSAIPAAKLDVIGDTKLQGNLNVTGVSTFSGGKASFDALGNISGRYISLDQGNSTKYIDANIANSNSITFRGYVGNSYQLMADFTRGGSCGLNFSGNRKLETTNTGIDVTGGITADDLRTDNSKTFYLTSDNDWRFRKTGGSEVLRITSANNVGIGITNPKGKLDISFAGAPNFITFGSDADNPKMEWFRSTGGSPSHYATEIQMVLGDLVLSTSATANLGSHSYNEKLRINSGGRVIIGHSQASGDLHGPQGTTGRNPFIQLHGTNTSDAGLGLISWKNSAGAYYAPSLFLAHSGSDTKGTNGILPSNGEFGSIVFSGDDGTDFVKGAMIKARLDGTPGNDDMPGRLEFHTTPDGAQAPVERLRITSAGFVQIGAAANAAEAPLHVTAENSQGINAIFGAKDFVFVNNYNYADANIALQGRDADDNDTGAGIQFTTRTTANNNWLHGALTMGQDGYFRLLAGGAGTTAGTVKLVIDTSGRLLTGGATTSQGSTNADDLQIGANNQSNQTGITLGSASASSVRFADAGNDTAGAIAYYHNDDSMRFTAGGSPRLTITSTGNVDINGTPPWSVSGGDYRNLSISGQTANSSGFLWLGNGTQTANADFDVGRINFMNGANVVARVIGSTQTGAFDDGRLTFYTKTTGQSEGERLRIRGDGKVQIGAQPVSTSGLLNVKGSAVFDDGTNARITLGSDGTSTTQILSTTTNFGSYCNMSYQAADHIFKYGGNQKFRVMNNGKILCGEGAYTGAGYPSVLQVQGASALIDLNTTNSNPAIIYFYEQGAGRFRIQARASDGFKIRDTLNSSDKISIHMNGDIRLDGGTAGGHRSSVDVRQATGRPPFNIGFVDGSFYRNLGTAGPRASDGTTNSGNQYLHVRFRTVWNDYGMTLFRVTGYISYSDYTESYVGMYRYGHSGNRINPYGLITHNQKRNTVVAAYNTTADPGYLVIVCDWNTDYMGLMFEHIGAGSNYGAMMQQDLEIIDSKRSSGTSDPGSWS